MLDCDLLDGIGLAMGTQEYPLEYSLGTQSVSEAGESMCANICERLNQKIGLLVRALKITLDVSKATLSFCCSINIPSQKALCRKSKLPLSTA
jgi:hypothetical protein